MWYVFWALSMAFIVGVIVIYATLREVKEKHHPITLSTTDMQSIKKGIFDMLHNTPFLRKSSAPLTLKPQKKTDVQKKDKDKPTK